MIRRMGCIQNFDGETFFWQETGWEDNVKIVHRKCRLRGMELAQEILPNMWLSF